MSKLNSELSTKNNTVLQKVTKNKILNNRARYQEVQLKKMIKKEF